MPDRAPTPHPASCIGRSSNETIAAISGTLSVGVNDAPMYLCGRCGRSIVGGGGQVARSRAGGFDNLHGGKIVTVDGQFSVQQAMAVRGDRIVKLGSNNEVLALRGDQTKAIDLAGKSVLPGLDRLARPSDRRCDARV